MLFCPLECDTRIRALSEWLNVLLTFENVPCESHLQKRIQHVFVSHSKSAMYLLLPVTPKDRPYQCTRSADYQHATLVHAKL